MKTFMTCLFLTFFSVVPPKGAQAQNYEESMRLLKVAAAICKKHFPSKKKMGDAAKSAGFKSEGVNGRSRVYSGNGKRFIFGVGNGNCLFAIESWTDKQAVATAKSVLLKSFKKASVAKKIERNLVADWRGEYVGTSSQLGVTKPIRVGWMTTPLIVIAKTK